MRCDFFVFTKVVFLLTSTVVPVETSRRMIRVESGAVGIKHRNTDMIVPAFMLHHPPGIIVVNTPRTLWSAGLSNFHHRIPARDSSSATRDAARTAPRQRAGGYRNLRSMMSADETVSRSDWPEPTLEEEMDAIDDVFMDRLPGEGRDKVKVFGAWLDADVAGMKAGKGNRAAAIVARAQRGEELNSAEKAEVFYEEAIMEMRDGKYDTSYSLLEKAVSLAGEDSRRGGEFKLWAVQALQGVGRRKQAAELLKSMKYHSDRDVRKVSSELLYIAQAPELKLTDDDFVQFPDVSHINDPFDKDMWKELSKPKVAPYKSKKKENGQGYYIGKDTGQAPGYDPVMMVTCVGGILALSYLFLG